MSAPCDEEREEKELLKRKCVLVLRRAGVEEGGERGATAVVVFVECVAVFRRWAGHYCSGVCVCVLLNCLRRSRKCATAAVLLRIYGYVAVGELNGDEK